MPENECRVSLDFQGVSGGHEKKFGKYFRTRKKRKEEWFMV